MTALRVATDPVTDRLPLSPLLALATAVFITSLTETLPAGVLTGMSASLHVHDPAMGQSITIYAIGTALTAVPLSAATAQWRRKRLLFTAMVGFLAANTVTAVAPGYALVMGARFLAGVAAGVAWSMLAGYARRLAPAHLAGRSIAVAMTGIPVALSLGVPAGAWLGHAVDWRAAFVAVSLMTICVIGWISVAVADFPGEPSPARGGSSMVTALKVRGVLSVLSVTLVFVLAHTMMYAFIARYLAEAGQARHTDLVLLVFGLASLVSIWMVGKHVDGNLRRLTIGSILLVAAAMLTFAFSRNAVAIFVASTAWGLGWGGAPTLLQTAGVVAGGRHSQAAADAAQSMLVTLWNAAMALGGSTGGIILAIGGVTALPAATALLSLPALVLVVAARQHGFTQARSQCT